MRTVFDYLTDMDLAALTGPAVARLDAFLGAVLDEPDQPGPAVG
ncbi:MAG TPA: hypothetical protein VK194_03050 [Candidatus Deferrimicrobium sp.]|nr:hypothetical protein [Candidatus Deferrimicrobium sp.]